MRIIRARDCRSMPWKNGGGTTTEIAAFPEGASLSDFDWRISMAHVGQDGPFSAFPGIDRTLSVLTGKGITLAFGDGEAVTLDRASPPYPFAADRAVDGRLVAGPIDDLNVMTRRGRWRHEVTRLSGSGPHAFLAADGLLVLVATQGLWRVRGEELAAGDSALLDAPGRLEAASEHDGDMLFAIRLMPMR